MNSPQRTIALAALLLCGGTSMAFAQPAMNPKTIIDARETGARGDARSFDTAAIQSAIDRANQAGGGRVVLSAGTYLCRTLTLKDGVELHLQRGATLLGSPDVNHYQRLNEKSWNRGFLLARDARNIAITGEGIVDGNDVFDAKGEAKMRGPHLLLMEDCRDVTVQGVTLRNAGNYAFLFYGCQDVTVQGATFEGGWDGVHFRNAGDRLNDPRWCKNVLISGCRFSTGDDAIAGGYVENLTVEKSYINSSCNGLRLIGPAKKLTVRESVFEGPGRYPHRKSGRSNMLAGIILQPSAWEPWPGVLEDVHLHDLEMRGVLTAFQVATRAGNPAKNVLIERVRADFADDAQVASSVESWDEAPLSDVTLRDIELRAFGGGRDEWKDLPIRQPGRGVRRLPAWGLYAHNIDGLQVERVALVAQERDPRPAALFQGVEGLQLADLSHNASAPTPVQLQQTRMADGAKLRLVADAPAAKPQAPRIGAQVETLGQMPLSQTPPTMLPGANPMGPNWGKGATLYQINLHNFTNERTIAAAQKELPRLAKSGVEVVWLMPVHPRGEMKPKREFQKANGGASPIPVPLEARDTKFRGNPYCPRDHMAIDALLGDFADLKRFTDAAHALGLKVILGWVPNHTSWDAPLITQHTDWYMRDKEGRVQQHGGWEPIARLSYAKRDSGLWEYMLKARQKFVEQGGVDGFREDVAGRTPLEFWQWMRPRLDPDNQLLMLAEADEAELYGPFDMAYDWKLPAIFWQILDGDGTTDLIDAHLREQAEEIGKGAHYLRYLFNHDQTGSTRGHWQGRVTIEQLYGAMDGNTVPTHRDKYGVALPAVQVLNALLPGSHPLIFMGMESGYYGDVPHNRAPNFNLPPADPAADMSGFYADLSALHRRSDGAMFRRVPAGSNPKIYAFEREPSRDERLLIVVNLDKKNAQTVQLPVGRAQGLADVSPRLPGGAGAGAEVADTFVLPPGGFRVWATPQTK